MDDFLNDLFQDFEDDDEPDDDGLLYDTGSTSPTFFQMVDFEGQAIQHETEDDMMSDFFLFIKGLNMTNELRNDPEYLIAEQIAQSLYPEGTDTDEEKADLCRKVDGLLYTNDLLPNLDKLADSPFIGTLEMFQDTYLIAPLVGHEGYEELQERMTTFAPRVIMRLNDLETSLLWSRIIMSVSLIMDDRIMTDALAVYWSLKLKRDFEVVQEVLQDLDEYDYPQLGGL